MMEWLKSFALRIKTLMRRRQLEADLDDELAFHKAMRESNPAAEGTRRFGNVTRLKEQCREQWTFPILESIFDDVRYALRRVRKAPAFSVITVLIMALGIGANTAIFSLMDAVMLRLLPVRQPEELVHVALTDSPGQTLPVPFWEALRDRQDVFSGVFAWSQEPFNLARGGEARNVEGLFVSGDYFTTLGVGPAAGRVLTVNDDFRGCPGAAVLSYGFWESHFGGDPNTIGQVITLNGYPVQVVGISAAGFSGVVAGNKFDVAIPICAQVPRQGTNIFVRIMGRLKPGLNAEEANARLAALSPSLFATLPNDILGPRVRTMHLGAFPSSNGFPGSGIRGTYERPLQTMMVVVGVVLLIACSNIACLLLARSTARNREIAVRRAIGASRWRLVRQLLTECLLLSLAGGLLGLFLARWGFAFLVGFISTPLYATQPGIFLDFSLDWRILGFTAGVTMLASILFAVVPSILSTGASLIWAIKGQHAEETEHRRVFRPARWIVAVEVALSLVLLVISGLFLKSFWKLATLDLGFAAENVLLVKVDLNNAKVPDSQQPAVREEILARLRSLPGVTSASQSIVTPIGGMGLSAPIHSHLPNAPTGQDAQVAFNFVSPGFFSTLGTPLLAGRDFTDGDTAHTQPVAIINQTTARRFFREDNPVRKYYSPEGPLFDPQQREFLVIGVVKDAKYAFLREDSRATAYYPAAQMPIRADFRPDWTFEIRAALRPSGLERAAGDAIESVNSAASFQFSLLEQQVNNSIEQERLLALLSGFFGGLALLLAMIGVYGVLSYSVAQRKKEIGIRMAVGAGRRTILRLVLRDVGVLLFLGCSAGVLLALWTTELLATLLFGIQPRDLATLASCVALLATTGLIAGYLPARRASRLDPMPILREE
jgi:putative ABC transport system permease protein